MTPMIYLQPNGGGYDICHDDNPTSLPDGYIQVAIVGKYGDATIASLTVDELAAFRQAIDAVLS